jgi:hypothetical protein
MNITSEGGTQGGKLSLAFLIEGIVHALSLRNSRRLSFTPLTCAPNVGRASSVL